MHQHGNLAATYGHFAWPFEVAAIETDKSARTPRKPSGRGDSFVTTGMRLDNSFMAYGGGEGLEGPDTANVSQTWRLRIDFRDKSAGIRAFTYWGYRQSLEKFFLEQQPKLSRKVEHSNKSHKRSRPTSCESNDHKKQACHW